MNRLLKKVFLTMVLTCLAGMSHAQKHAVGIALGQSYALFKNKYVDAAEPYNQPYSLGAGNSTLFSYRYIPDSSNWYFSAGLEWFQGNQSVYAAYKIDSFNRGGTSRSIHSLNAFAQLNYVFHLGAFNLELKSGFVLPFVNKCKEVAYVTDSNGTLIRESTYKHYMAIGYKGGLGLSTRLTGRIACFLDAELQLLNMKVKSSKINALNDPADPNRLSNMPEAFKSVNYRKDPFEIRNNRDVLPAGFNSSKPTDRLTYAQSISGLGIRFGLIFYL